MRLGSINGLRCKQLKLVILAFFMMFLLWKWEKGTYYNTEILRPDSLVLTHPDQRTASKEDFPSTDSLQQSVVKVEKQVTGAPPGLSIVDDYVDVADEKEASPSEKKECNYRNGKWVSDNLRPLYSGFGYKQWLSESWACRLTQHTDFAYEKFRWQPEACEMPEFEASQFLRRMQDKTIAYVGDSLGRQMFQSMMCMVTGGKERPDVEDGGAEYGFVLAPRAKRTGNSSVRRIISSML